MSTTRRHINTVWSKFSGHLTVMPIWAWWTSQSKNTGINTEYYWTFIWPDNSRHSSGKALHKILECVCLNHSTERVFVRSGTDVGFLPKVFSGVEVSALCLSNHVFMNLTLWPGSQSYWNSKGISPNCWHKVRSAQLVKMSLYCVETLELRGP